MAELAVRARPQRKAKRTDVDYAVLSSGQQIPEYSSEEDESDDDEPFSGARKRKRKPSSAAREQCFICLKQSKSPFIQCDNCSRLFHARCGRPFESASILGNTSCHECLQEARISSLSAQPRPSIDSIDAFVALLKRAKKVVVIAGAGISVSCGIPDFRSKDGIYNMARHMDVALPEPECLFQIEYFRQDPAPFFQIVRSAFAHSPAPSATHRFLKLLQDKKKLLRVYTQNIDGLEEAAGVTRVIPCHGSFAWSTCMRCRARVPTSELMGAIQAGVIPTCSLGDCRGVLKPDITFFGEVLDDTVSTSITRDRLQADLLLVMGTSLKVAPVMEIPGYLPAHIPQVVINMTALKKKKLKTKKKKTAIAMATTVAQSSGGGDAADATSDKDDEEFDLSLLGDCDQIVRYICSRARWDLDATKPDSGQDDVQIVQVDPPPSKSDARPGKKNRTAVNTKKEARPPRIISHEGRERRKRVFCFGECHCAKRLAIAAEDASSESDPEPDRVVCNRCAVRIDGDEVAHFRCLDCFDYDLCGSCYAERKDRHKNGKHRFSQVLD